MLNAGDHMIASQAEILCYCPQGKLIKGKDVLGTLVAVVLWNTNCL